MQTTSLCHSTHARFRIHPSTSDPTRSFSSLLSPVSVPLEAKHVPTRRCIFPGNVWSYGRDRHPRHRHRFVYCVPGHLSLSVAKKNKKKKNRTRSTGVPHDNCTVHTHDHARLFRSKVGDKAPTGESDTAPR